MKFVLDTDLEYLRLMALTDSIIQNANLSNILCSLVLQPLQKSLYAIFDAYF